jgi:hypothetical protein
MPTKKDMLQEKTKAQLLNLASKAGIDSVKRSMRKDEMVNEIAKSRKVTKSDLA